MKKKRRFHILKKKKQLGKGEKVKKTLGAHEKVSPSLKKKTVGSPEVPYKKSTAGPCEGFTFLKKKNPFGRPEKVSDY